MSEVFTQLNVPHYRVEEFQFFRRKEIKDVLACLSLICNPYNMSAAHRVAVNFIPGVGSKKLGRIVSHDAQLGLWLTDLFSPDTFTCQEPFGRLLEAFDRGWITVLDTETTGLSPVSDNIIELAYCRLHQGGVQEQRQTLLTSEKPVGDSFFTHNISDAQLAAEGEDPGQILVRFAEECGQGLIEELKIREHFQDEPKRRANIEHLVRFFQDQDPKHLHPYKALQNLVEYASLAKNVDHIDRNSANVLVVPVHQSKGLEFDTVFIAGAVDGMMPMFRAQDLEEEKRVFYVAMTRPKKRLYISGFKTFVSRNENSFTKRMTEYVDHFARYVEYL